MVVALRSYKSQLREVKDRVDRELHEWERTSIPIINDFKSKSYENFVETWHELQNMVKRSEQEVDDCYESFQSQFEYDGTSLRNQLDHKYNFLLNNISSRFHFCNDNECARRLVS